jgi:hypothetical protein
VARRQLLPDVLAEFVLSQERDELGTYDDGHDHRDHRRGKDADQLVARI